MMTFRFRGETLFTEKNIKSFLDEFIEEGQEYLRQSAEFGMINIDREFEEWYKENHSAGLCELESKIIQLKWQKMYKDIPPMPLTPPMEVKL